MVEGREAVRALVFSAGGTFGAYQAGVWRALEELRFDPQIVVGASIGAVNATAVARGATGKRLVDLWRDPKSAVFRWNWPPRGVGVFDRRPLEARLGELVREFPRLAPGVRHLVTLTELPTMAIRVIPGEEVTAEVLLAACAIPGVFPPVRVGERWMVDGGLFCRLPVAVAVEAGATEIVTVDLLAAPPSALARGLVTAACGVRKWLTGAPDLMAVPKGVRVCRVEARRALGAVRDVMRWDLHNVNRWIEAGYRDALEALQASAAQASSPTAERAAPR